MASMLAPYKTGGRTMTPTRFLPFLLILATPLPAAAWVVAGDTVYTMRVDADVEVDEAGNVASHTISTRLAKDIQVYLDQSIAGWRFQPPMHEGTPTRAFAKARITLAARHREDGQYDMQLDNVAFLTMYLGDVTFASKHNIKRPAAIVNAIVSVAVQISPDGKTMNAAATQCTILAKARAMDEASMCARLSRNAEEGLRKVRYTFGRAPARPIEGVVPVHFEDFRRTRIDEILGSWRLEWRTPFRQPAWTSKGIPRIGASDLIGDGFVQHAAGLRLLEGSSARTTK